MNAKEIIKNDFKKSGLISFIYRKYTPSNGVTYNTNHKNWHIAEGVGYGSSIRLNYGLDMLKKVLETKNISLVADKLRQDKEQNKYFWVGMKLACNAEA